MLTEKKTIERDTLEIMCTERLMPKHHLLRKIDEAVDFERLYEIVVDLYCKVNGRPSIDPIVLFSNRYKEPHSGLTERGSLTD